MHIFFIYHHVYYAFVVLFCFNTSVRAAFLVPSPVCFPGVVASIVECPLDAVHTPSGEDQKCQIAVIIHLESDKTPPPHFFAKATF